MDNKTVLSDNELIAEFMGLKVSPVGHVLYSNGKKLLNCEDLRYDDSWDWLMLVVQKIEKEGVEIDKYYPLDHPYFALCEFHITADIKDVHKAVVEFIKWYNSTKTL